MGEIVEVFEDVKKSIGDKGFYILIGGVALLFVVNLLKEKDDTDTGTVTVATGYASYPDAVTNADVIVDTIQHNIDYSQQEIMSKLNELTEGNAGINEELKDYLQNNFEATNGYIADGLGSITDLANKIDNLENAVSCLDGESIGTPPRQNGSGYRDAVIPDGIVVTSLNNTVSYYTPTNYTGVSIVDGLKSIGVDSTFNNRKNIAVKNGITNYTGTASQNLSLLNKLKNGTLIK